jgi:hypothetical protein
MSGKPRTPSERYSGRIRPQLAAIPSANIFAFGRPAIQGLGNTSGFNFQLQALGDQTPQELSSVTRAMVVAANQDPVLSGVFSTYSADVPQVFLNLDRTKAELLQVPVCQGLFNIAGATWLPVCQRPESLQPCLSGESPGRHPFSGYIGGHRPHLRTQQ